MKDNWTSATITGEGKMVYGGAARNVRIKKRGGMDAICREAGEFAARVALQMADLVIDPSNDPKVALIKEKKKGSEGPKIVPIKDGLTTEQ